MAKFDKDAQGRAIQKIYKRIGLRRDQNFGDLTSPTDALENLLDKLNHLCKLSLRHLKGTKLNQ